MNLKRLFFSSVVAMGLAGCGVDDASVRVLEPVFLDEDCKPLKDQSLLLGNLDLALIAQEQVRTAFWPFTVDSYLTDTGYGQNDLSVETVELSYEMEPPLGVLQPQTFSLSAYLRAESTNTLDIPLFPGPALDELAAVGLDQEGATVWVSFVLHGRRASGGTLVSNEKRFAVRVYTSQLACPAGTAPTPVGCEAANAALVCL
jgi:hypothetical protein